MRPSTIRLTPGCGATARCRRGRLPCTAGQTLLLDVTHSGNIAVVITLTLIFGIPVTVYGHLTHFKGRVRRPGHIGGAVRTLSAQPLTSRRRTQSLSGLVATSGLLAPVPPPPPSQVLVEYTEMEDLTTIVAFGLRDAPALEVALEVRLAQMHFECVAALAPLRNIGLGRG